MIKFISKIGHYLFSKRLQKWRALFIVAALPLILYSIWGWEYGASLFYAIPALISIAQFFYPTMFAWIVLAFLYSTWTALYWFAVLVDVYRIVIGKRSDVTIFIDFNDTAFFLIYIVFITVILWGLLKTKPKFERS